MPEDSLRFASPAWWRDHPVTDPAIVYAIQSLSSVERTSEAIWKDPTAEEWEQTAQLAAEYGDEDDLALGERAVWGMLLGFFHGEPQAAELFCPVDTRQ